MSFDVLQEKIIRMKNPTVVGLDPKPEYVPEHIRKASYEQFGETFEGAADAISSSTRASSTPCVILYLP